MVDRYTPLGQRLADEGRTQAWLARRLTLALGREVYRQEVYRWCKPGDRTPEHGTRAVIASLLGASADDLFPAHSRDLPTHPSSADNPHRHEEAA